MKTKLLWTLILIITLLPLALAESEHGYFSEAKNILEQNIPYEQITDDQFELLGDYYMDLMSGDRHEFMDNMMGGEGSESLRQAHINMGERFYQDYLDTELSQNEWITKDNTKYYGGMMGGNMVYNSGMMGNVGWVGMGLFWLIYIAIAAFVFGIVFWWTYRLVIKDNKKRNKRK